MPRGGVSAHTSGHAAPEKRPLQPEDYDTATICRRCGGVVEDGKPCAACPPPRPKRRLCTSCWRPGHNRATCDGPFTENELAAGGAR